MICSRGAEAAFLIGAGQLLIWNCSVSSSAASFTIVELSISVNTLSGSASSKSSARSSSVFPLISRTEVRLLNAAVAVFAYFGSTWNSFSMFARSSLLSVSATSARLAAFSIACVSTFSSVFILFPYKYADILVVEIHAMLISRLVLPVHAYAVFHAVRELGEAGQV